MFVRQTPSPEGPSCIAVDLYAAFNRLTDVIVMRKLRNRRLTVRFTEEEFEKLMIQMQFAGFNSMSFYARSVLLEGRIRRRNLSKSTSNMMFSCFLGGVLSVRKKTVFDDDANEATKDTVARKRKKTGC